GSNSSSPLIRFPLLWERGRRRGPEHASPSILNFGARLSPRLRSFRGRALVVSSLSIQPLPNLLCSECANAVQAKREDETIFIAETNIEGEVLHGHRTTLPRVTDGRRRADQRAVAAGEWMLLKIEEQRKAAEQSLLLVAQKQR